MSSTLSTRFGVGLTGLILLAASTRGAWGEEVKFGPCYARWNATELVVGNEHVERKWTIDGGLLRATSLYDRDTKTEWLSPAKNKGTAVAGKMTFAAHGGVLSPVEAPSLEIEIGNGKVVQYRMQVFPKARGVEIDLQPGEPMTAAVKAESDAGGASTPASHRPQSLSLRTQHKRAWVHGCRAPLGSDCWLEVDGANSGAIMLQGNELSGAETPLRVGKDVPAGSVAQK